MVTLRLSLGPPRRLANPLIEMVVDVPLPLRPSLRDETAKAATKKPIRERRVLNFPSR
jgi:hypothetical protein